MQAFSNDRRLITTFVAWITFVVVVSRVISTHAIEPIPEYKRILPADITEVPSDDAFEEEGWLGTFARMTHTREQWSNTGLSVSGAIVWDGSRNLHGGIDTEHAISRYLLGVGFSADLEKIMGWHGATAFFDFQTHDGTLGDTIVGDFQVFSNIDAPRRTQIPRAWLETHWLDDQLRVKVGKIDANTEFAYTLGGGSFLNSSMGFSPTIFVMPTYPDPAGGFIAEWISDSSWKMRIGVFDGVGATGVPTGSRLPTTLLDDFENLFTIFGADRTWGDQADATAGRLALGGWYHNGEFDQFDGGIQSGTYGWFATADQWLWNEGECDIHNVQGIAAFAQLGWADERVSQAARHWGLGLNWTGMIHSRDADVIGLGVSGVEFSSVAGTGLTAEREVATELFYQAMLPRGWSITSDVQAITNPGGFAERGTALVTTLRVIREF